MTDLHVMLRNINFILQGKGGVGKSFIAVLIAQYFLDRFGSAICADTDPVNATFTKYKSLDVAHIEIAENGSVIQRKFDPLMELMMSTDANFVVDNGAATFLPLTRYLAENDIYRIMAEAGKKVIVHTVLTGGQAKSDTYSGFAELLSKVNQHARIVVWQNEFMGKIEYDGHPITSSKLFRDAEREGKIAGIVRIADRSQSDTFVGDIKQMTESNMTLAEVMASTEFNYFSKNRLQKVVSEVFADLDRVEW